MRRILLAVAVLLWSASPLFAQAAQIQAAIQALLQGTNVWTGQTNTFTHDVVILGTCTGCGGGGGTPSAPVNSIQFNNAGSFGGSSSLVWDGTNMTVDIGHAASLSNATVGISVLADDNTDPADAGAIYSTLNSTSFLTFIRGNGTLASPTPASAGNIIGDLSFNSLTSSGNYSATIQSVEVQGKVDSNASGSVKAGLFVVFTRGNDDLMHDALVAGVAATTLKSLSGVGDVGSNIALTAGDGDTGFNGGHIIGLAGGSATGTDAGRVEWRGGDSSGAARGGALVFQGGNSTGANGGNVGLAAGGSSNMGSAGGDVNISVGSGSGGATNGNMFLLGLPTTGAATKKVLCIDTGTGQLFMSTSDTQCLN